MGDNKQHFVEQELRADYTVCKAALSFRKSA